MSDDRTPAAPGQAGRPANACLIRAALRGEVALHDDDLLLVLGQEDGPERAKQLCVGLKAAGLITDDQAALAFHALALRGA